MVDVLLYVKEDEIAADAMETCTNSHQNLSFFALNKKKHTVLIKKVPFVV